jgi:hypothetical protein
MDILHALDGPRGGSTCRDIQFHKETTEVTHCNYSPLKKRVGNCSSTSNVPLTTLYWNLAL